MKNRCISPLSSLFISVSCNKWACICCCFWKNRVVLFRACTPCKLFTTQLYFRAWRRMLTINCYHSLMHIWCIAVDIRTLVDSHCVSSALCRDIQVLCILIVWRQWYFSFCYLQLNAVSKKWGGGRSGHWLVRMEWRQAGWLVCLPLLIFSCIIKSRSSLLAPAHPGGPGKRAIKRLWWWWY